MVKRLILLLLATFLSANPKIYSALGDVIYNNVEIIESLKKISEFKEQEAQIDEYVKSVYAAKEMGFSIEEGTQEIDKKKYLKTIRELSKINDMFFRLAQNMYKESIEQENTLLWSKLINSGLIDTQKHKDEVLEFYFEHSKDIDEEGVIQKFLDQEKKLKTKSTKKNDDLLMKKEAQEEKIKRIREKDKLKQEAIQKALEEELKKKKTQIRSNQVKGDRLKFRVSYI
ncbi:hypothetical protein M947_07010 [Sulfurimonas hongkongensis]|uniref:SurA N-terminal domain-containing protein n=1 Tax=Sulfurimonas hongkongensis TaxID=1172190 RepID=T0JMA9_9BACT|nr:hypothetical protein [Sulfurimonas hongkongensis]EQB39221.1 hypothetical protein M947_07010 [Sulfurimonas hongkongensis]